MHDSIRYYLIANGIPSHRVEKVSETEVVIYSHVPENAKAIWRRNQRKALRRRLRAQK